MAAIAIASWIAISNHCAFAALAPTADPAPNECPFHSKPAKPQQPPVALQCCKILRAITTTVAKAAAPAVVDLPYVDLRLGRIRILPAAEISFVLIPLDTGPPGTTSFAELVGSVRAHAPPAAA